jgi:hypothetical protein
MTDNLGVGEWKVGLCKLSYPEPLLWTRMQSIFVYCELILPQPVGDLLVR